MTELRTLCCRLSFRLLGILTFQSIISFRALIVGLMVPFCSRSGDGSQGLHVLHDTVEGFVLVLMDSSHDLNGERETNSVAVSTLNR